MFEIYLKQAEHLHDNYPAEYRAWVEEEEERKIPPLLKKCQDLHDRMDELENELWN